VNAVIAPAPITPADRLGFTVFVAIIAHAILILGVSFVSEDHARRRTDTLDIVLVQQRSEQAPDEADYLAQANLDGGGETSERARPSTPLPAPLDAPAPEIASAAPPLPPAPVLHATPAPPPQPPAPEAPEKPVAAPAAAAAPPAPAPRPVLAQRRSASRDRVVRAPPAPRPERKARPRLQPSRLARIEPAPAPAPAPKRSAPGKPRKRAPDAPPPAAPPSPTRTLDAAALVRRSLAMASLDAEIDRKLSAYAKRPRRKWVTARTREHKYAAYMEAWRRKVERIGNLNYPDEARRRRLSGSLLLEVALNADGTINQIVLRRSSGKRVLDDAAMRIVRLAAPFARFPKSIARETDILHIQRTWRFLSGGRFSG